MILDGFIVPDAIDRSPKSRHPRGSHILPSSPSVPRTKYGDVVHALSQRYGSRSDDSVDETEDAFEILDDSGLWTMINDWLNGSVAFDRLTEIFDFHVGKHVKIGYWEDLVSNLAFENDLDKRDAIFNAIPFEEHIRRLHDSNDHPAAHSQSIFHPLSPSPPPSPDLSRSDTNSQKLWSAQVVPSEFHMIFL